MTTEHHDVTTSDVETRMLIIIVSGSIMNDTDGIINYMSFTNHLGDIKLY